MSKQDEVWLFDLGIPKHPSLSAEQQEAFEQAIVREAKSPLDVKFMACYGGLLVKYREAGLPGSVDPEEVKTLYHGWQAMQRGVGEPRAAFLEAAIDSALGVKPHNRTLPDIDQLLEYIRATRHKVQLTARQHEQDKHVIVCKIIESEGPRFFMGTHDIGPHSSCSGRNLDEELRYLRERGMEIIFVLHGTNWQELKARATEEAKSRGIPSIYNLY